MKHDLNGDTSLEVSSLWVGESLSPYEQLALSSFTSLGYQVNLYIYEDVSGIPDNINVVDARIIVDEKLIFRNPSFPNTYAHFSDFFRYSLLHTTDTTWIDTDVVALSRLPKDDFLIGWQDSDLINMSVLRLPPDSEFLTYLLEQCDRLGTEFETWGATGPDLVTEAVGIFGLQQQVQAQHVLYPISYREVWRLYDPRQCERLKRATEGASTVHLWNEVLRRAPKPIKQMSPPKGSFMSHLFESHDILPPNGSTPSLYWLRYPWRLRLKDF